uniref:DA-P36 family member n=1 Tax=Rhipicephalus appendiculatus TaxID=34631 RepID=A0A131YSB6_RHIAP
MRMSYAHGIYLLVFSSMVNRGGSFVLNFTKIAYEYIEEQNKTEKGKINSWGFTKEYAFWKENGSAEIPPVTAKVAWMIYGDCHPHTRREIPKMNCSGHFSWAFHEGIVCPFHLQYNTTLPIWQRGPEPKNFTLELDRYTGEAVVFTWGHSHDAKLFQAKCHFVAKISFTGYLVYNLTDPGERNSTWVTVNITKFANNSEELEVKRGKLTFYEWGVYFERMWCASDQNKVK